MSSSKSSSKSVKFKAPQTKLELEIASKAVNKGFKKLKVKNTSSLDTGQKLIKKKKKAVKKKRSQSIPMTSTSVPIIQINGLEALSASASLDNLKIQPDEAHQTEKSSVQYKYPSYDSFAQDAKTSNQKILESYMPRRRFSQGAFGPIKDMLQRIEVEEEEKQKNNQDIENHPIKEFSDMTREERLEELQKTNESNTKDWVGLKSLTGANASGWKFTDSTYGNFNVGRRPSMDTAWGRRVYDQYEIEFDVDKPQYNYMQAKSLGIPKTMTKKQAVAIGVWDVIFNREVVSVLEGAKKWEADHEDKQKAIKKLNIDMEKLQDQVVITDDTSDPVNKFKLHFGKTGSYLRPNDLQFCLDGTNFTEDQIIEWFKRFRTDCPDGKLTVDHLRRLYKQSFPRGDSIKFSKHIMRIFDSDGNGFLDFKEFLLAIDIATCTTEESRLDWVFKLYDVDNDGIIDVYEMASIMETMECLDSNECSIIDDTCPLDRAQNLFNCIDHANELTLTKEEFIAGYLERSLLMEKQDAHEQKKKLDGLILRGPLIPALGEISQEKLPHFVSNLINCRTTKIQVSKSKILQVVLRAPSENYPKSILVRFHEQSMRNKLWGQRQDTKKQGLILEEYLTDTRAKLFKKCKELKSRKLIKDCFTERGNIYVKILVHQQDDQFELIQVNNDSAYEELIHQL